MFGDAARTRRRQEQLCRQVEERLGLVLGGEVDDPLLAEMILVGVEPEPYGPNVVALFALPPGSRWSVAEALRRLERLRPLLRAEVAAAIHRKRAPQIGFRVVPHAAAGPDEEVPA